jgi:zinc/manganese transport system substrate-binding protein
MSPVSDLRRRAFVTGLIAAPGLARADAPLSVTASFSILADMVRQIAGGLASVRSLVPVDGDAHTFEPRPSDLQAVANARLLIENGLGFEGWMTRLRQTADYSGLTVVAGTGVKPGPPRNWGCRDELGIFAPDLGPGVGAWHGF